jgi:hypothetical protein
VAVCLLMFLEQTYKKRIPNFKESRLYLFMVHLTTLSLARTNCYGVEWHNDYWIGKGVKGIISVSIPVRTINSPNQDYRSLGLRIRGRRATHLTAMFMRLNFFRIHSTIQRETRINYKHALIQITDHYFKKKDKMSKWPEKRKASNLNSGNSSPTFLCYDTDRIENEASNNPSNVACLFIAAVTFLARSCLATIKRKFKIRMRSVLLSRALREVCFILHWGRAFPYKIDCRLSYHSLWMAPYKDQINCVTSRISWHTFVPTIFCSTPEINRLDTLLRRFSVGDQSETVRSTGLHLHKAHTHKHVSRNKEISKER